jgi:hypothetical protein
MSERLSMQGMRRPGIVPGILVSLVLHAVLIFGYRLAAPTPAPDLPPNRTMTVWLRPLAPPARPAIAEPAKLEPATPLTPRPLRQRPAVARTTAPASAPAPAQPQTATAAAITPTAEPYDPLRADITPSFDMEAARKAARRVATEKDTMRADSLAKRLEDHPLYPEDKETQLQKGVARAQRADCRTSAAGAGILAPLVWLLDKKDSGCKW